MTAKEQYKWSQLANKFSNTRVSSWTPAIHKALQAQVKPTIDTLNKSGLHEALAALPMSIDIEPLSTVIKNIYLDAGRVWGQHVYQLIKKQAITQKRLIPIGFNEDMVNAINDYFKLFLLSKAVLPISNTTRALIFDILTKGQVEGWSIQQIVNALDNTELSRNRARVIARTEVGKATSYSSINAARKSGYLMNKIWISTQDFRTRRIAAGGTHEHDEFDHFRMNGVTIPLNELFQVPRRHGGFEPLMQPKDPNGSAADVIQCRCTLGYKILRDSAGRPLLSN